MKKLFINLFFTLIVHSVFGQDTIYYDNKWNETQSFKTASFFKIINTSKNKESEIVEKVYYKSGQIKSEIFYFIDKKKKKNRTGKSSFWYETGVLKNEISYKNGKTDGEFISYWENGKLKRKDNFKKGKLKEGKCFNEQGEEVDYYPFEILPEYPGGKKAFRKLIKEKLLEGGKNVKGKLIVRFIINTDGKPIKPVILRDTNPSSIKEITNLFNSMPKWKPGILDGIPIQVKMNLPVRFD